MSIDKICVFIQLLLLRMEKSQRHFLSNNCLCVCLCFLLISLQFRQLVCIKSFLFSLILLRILCMYKKKTNIFCHLPLRTNYSLSCNVLLYYFFSMFRRQFNYNYTLNSMQSFLFLVLLLQNVCCCWNCHLQLMEEIFCKIGKGKQPAKKPNKF